MLYFFLFCFFFASQSGSPTFCPKIFCPADILSNNILSDNISSGLHFIQTTFRPITFCPAYITSGSIFHFSNFFEKLEEDPLTFQACPINRNKFESDLFKFTSSEIHELADCSPPLVSIRRSWKKRNKNNLSETNLFTRKSLNLWSSSFYILYVNIKTSFRICQKLFQ